MAQTDQPQPGWMDTLRNVIGIATDHLIATACIAAFIGSFYFWGELRKSQNSKGRPLAPLGAIIKRTIRFAAKEDNIPLIAKPEKLATKVQWLTGKRLYLIGLPLTIIASWLHIPFASLAAIFIALILASRARKFARMRHGIIMQMFNVADGECRYPRGAALNPWSYIDVQSWQSPTVPGATVVTYPASYQSEENKTREKFERQFNGTVSDQNSWTYTWESSKNRVVCQPSSFLPTMATYPGPGPDWDKIPIGVSAGGVHAAWDVKTFPHSLVCGPTGSGKATALDTPIPTPTGLKTMGDMQVGDYVFAPDGTPTRVVAATDVLHGRKCFEITFFGGQKLVVDAQHEWTTRTTSDRRAGRLGVARTTEEIASTLASRPGKPGHNHVVNASGVAQYQERVLPIDPYYFGVWLGDGHSYSPTVISMDPEILGEFAASGLEVTRGEKKGRAFAWHVADPRLGRGGLLAALRTLNVLKSGTVPQFTINDVHVSAPVADDGAVLGYLEVAEILGLKKSMVQNLAAAGVIESALHGRTRLYNRASVLNIAQARAIGEDPALLSNAQIAEKFDMSGARVRRILTGSQILPVAFRFHENRTAERVYALADVERALDEPTAIPETKHIPDIYLQASEQQRRDLLAGLLDSDGTVKNNGRVSFSNSNERLARDAAQLVASLGYVATTTKAPSRFKQRAFKPTFNVAFMAPRSQRLFRLDRKNILLKEQVSPQTRQRAIIAVEERPSVPVRCIQVAHATHEYLVTASYIPTHNSVLQRNILFHALAHSDKWRIIGIDPKKVEMQWIKNYESVLRVATELEDSLDVLRMLKNEMHRRYTDMEAEGVNYFENLKAPPPAVLLMIDETTILLAPEKGRSEEGKLRDEMHAEAGMIIGELGRLARASGIHVIACMQRPDAEFLKGETKANFDCRIAAGRMDTTPSMMILDSEAATRLPLIKGRGMIRLGGGVETFQGFYAEGDWYDNYLAEQKVAAEHTGAEGEGGEKPHGRVRGPKGPKVPKPAKDGAGRFGKGMAALRAKAATPPAGDERGVESENPKFPSAASVAEAQLAAEAALHGSADRGEPGDDSEFDGEPEQDAPGALEPEGAPVSVEGPVGDSAPLGDPVGTASEPEPAAVVETEPEPEAEPELDPAPALDVEPEPVSAPAPVVVPDAEPEPVVPVLTTSLPTAPPGVVSGLPVRPGLPTAPAASSVPVAASPAPEEVVEQERVSVPSPEPVRETVPVAPVHPVVPTMASVESANWWEAGPSTSVDSDEAPDAPAVQPGGFGGLPSPLDD